MSFIERIKKSKSLKALALKLLRPKNEHRPRLWVQLFWNSWKHKKGKDSVIRRRTRIDVMPFNEFTIGRDSLIEDFATVNNQVGPVVIGDRSLIGISCVVIGPVTIGNDVLLAQHVVMSGLNHQFEDISRPINQQKCTTDKIVIEDEVWIGANVVITSGTRIGKHAVVAAGSVVTKDVPPYCVVAGNPARVIKKYDQQSNVWIKVKHKNNVLDELRVQKARQT